MKKLLFAILILAASQVSAQEYVNKSRVMRTIYVTIPTSKGGEVMTSTKLIGTKKYTKKQLDKMNHGIAWWINGRIIDNSIVEDLQMSSFIDSITITNLTLYKKYGSVTRTIYKKPK